MSTALALVHRSSGDGGGVVRSQFFRYVSGHVVQKQRCSPPLHCEAALPGPELAGIRSRAQATGDLTLCLDEAAIAACQAPRRATPGGQACYSDLAIRLVLMLLVFHLVTHYIGNAWPRGRSPRAVRCLRARWRGCHDPSPLKKRESDPPWPWQPMWSCQMSTSYEERLEDMNDKPNADCAIVIPAYNAAKIYRESRSQRACYRPTIS